MSIETRDAWDFLQELPGASMVASHARSLRGDKWGCQDAKRRMKIGMSGKAEVKFASVAQRQSVSFVMRGSGVQSPPLAPSKISNRIKDSVRFSLFEI